MTHSNEIPEPAQAGTCNHHLDSQHPCRHESFADYRIHRILHNRPNFERRVLSTRAGHSSFSGFVLVDITQGLTVRGKVQRDPALVGRQSGHAVSVTMITPLSQS